jgi:hypothetical protein
MPVFTAGPERVWGLTAYILRQVLDDVLVPIMGPTGKGAPSQATPEAGAGTSGPTASTNSGAGPHAAEGGPSPVARL